MGPIDCPETSVINYHYWLRNRGPLMVAQWLRYYATNRKVAGSIPDGVIRMALGSTQPLTEMSTRSISWG
jgi:hypothetical protein